MSFLLNVWVFVMLVGAALLAYRRQALWLRLLVGFLLKPARGRSFVFQWFVYAPIFVSYLLLCHYLDVQEWYGLAASGIGFAMILGLQAMRQCEEKQKEKRLSSCR